MDYKIIKELRKKYNWTQDQVAEMLWISRVTYNLLENWKTSREPYIDNLQDIFDISFSAINNNNHKKENQLIMKFLKNLKNYFYI